MVTDQFIIWDKEPLYPFGPVFDNSLKIYQQYLIYNEYYNIPNWNPNVEVFITAIKNNKLYPRYYVSNLARVFDIKSNRLLTFSYDKDQYSTCNIYEDECKKFKRTKLHRLVLESFVPIENASLWKVNHKCGIRPFDNTLYNLEWTDVLKNTVHGWETGLNTNIGEGNVVTVVDDKTVHQICKYLESGLRNCEICDKFGIIDKKDRMKFSAIISTIRHGKTRIDISSQYNLNIRRNRYSKEFGFLVCQFLVNADDNLTYGQLMDLLNIEEEDRNTFKVYVKNILNGNTIKDVKEYIESYYGRKLKEPKVDPIPEWQKNHKEYKK